MARINTGKSTLSIPILLMVLTFIFLVVRIYIKGPFQALLNPDSQIGWKTLTDLEQDKERYHSSLVLYDFSADWCQPCKRMDRVTFQAADVVKKIRDGFYPVKVIVGGEHEKRAVTDLQSKYSLYSIPTFVVTLPTGEWVYQRRGFYPPKDFLKLLENAQAKAHYVKSELKTIKGDYKGALAELDPDIVSGKKMVEEEIPALVTFHVLRMLGREADAKAMAEKRYKFIYSKKERNIPTEKDKPMPWPLPFYDFLLGKIDEDRLKNSSAVWWQKSDMYCAIALNQLANNNKDAAVKSFHKAAESSSYSTSDSYKMAELFLKELEP